MLPVSLVDSVTAKVDDEKKDLAYNIHMWYTSCCVLFKYTFYILFIWFLYAFYIHSRNISDTCKVKMKVKKWRPEKLKMVEKHFFPEMFGDLWGVICYHHWYPRAGLQGQKKDIILKTKNEV